MYFFSDFMIFYHFQSFYSQFSVEIHSLISLFFIIYFSLVYFCYFFVFSNVISSNSYQYITIMSTHYLSAQLLTSIGCVCVYMVIYRFFQEPDQLPQCINLGHSYYLITKIFLEMEFQQSDEYYGRSRSHVKC